MKELHPIFSSFLAFDYIDDNLDALISECNETLGDKGLVHLNYESLDTVGTQLNRINKRVEQEMRLVAREQLGLGDNWNVGIRSLWINKQYRPESTIIHQHSRSLLSAVYYPYAVEGESKLMFRNPNAMVGEKLPSTVADNIIMEWTPFNSVEWTIVPRTGLLVVFPAWLDHYVVSMTENPSLRLSIAFDGYLADNEGNLNLDDSRTKMIRKNFYY